MPQAVAHSVEVFSLCYSSITRHKPLFSHAVSSAWQTAVAFTLSMYGLYRLHKVACPKRCERRSSRLNVEA